MLALFALSAVAAIPALPQQTRVLLVDIDDVGYDLLAAAPTPVLDWVAANGRTFSSFTTAPLCSPTRAMIMTGAHPSHPDLLLGALVGPWDGWAMPLAPLEPLPRLLSNAGLSTAKVGKWHLCANLQRSHPNDAGFDHYAGILGNPGTVGYSGSYTKVVDGADVQVTGTYLTTDETDDAIAFVRASVDFVSISYHAPHAPFHEPPAHLHSIAPINSDWDRARAMLQACDRELGRLLREALPRGYTVMIASDNGTTHQLGGGKGTVRDDGVITPFFAIGPGVAPGIDPTRIGAEDLYATVADLLGVPTVGARRGPHSDSFARALYGAPEWRRWSYSERFAPLGDDPRTSGQRWLRAVRGARYKLVDEVNGAGESLYDLLADPDETVDLLQGGGLSAEASAALAGFRAVMARL